MKTNQPSNQAYRKKNWQWEHYLTREACRQREDQLPFLTLRASFDGSVTYQGYLQLGNWYQFVQWMSSIRSLGRRRRMHYRGKLWYGRYFQEVKQIHSFFPKVRSQSPHFHCCRTFDHRNWHSRYQGQRASLNQYQKPDPKSCSQDPYATLQGTLAKQRRSWGRGQ